METSQRTTNIILLGGFAVLVYILYKSVFANKMEIE